MQGDSKTRQSKAKERVRQDKTSMGGKNQLCLHTAEVFLWQKNGLNCQKLPIHKTCIILILVVFEHWPDSESPIKERLFWNLACWKEEYGTFDTDKDDWRWTLKWPSANARNFYGIIIFDFEMGSKTFGCRNMKHELKLLWNNTKCLHK